MSKSKLTVEQKITKAKNIIITDYPFFSVLMLKMKIVEEENQPTMCTDGYKIMYNPSFVDTMDIGEVVFVLVHEVMHCALGHLWRRDSRDKTIWNFATDFAINSIIKTTADTYYQQNSRMFGGVLTVEVKMPSGCLYNEDFKDKSAEEIYSILKKKAKKSKQGGGKGQGKGKGSSGSGSNSSNGKNNQNQNNNGSGQNNNGNGQNNNGGSSITYDGKTYNAPQNHDSWDKEDKSSFNNKTQQKIKWEGNLLSANEIAKKQGVGVLGMERLINEIKHPQKNWRVLLQDFIQEEFNDYSLMPPDKRYSVDFFMFDFNDTIEVVNDILFFVDTSGSMGSREMDACYSEIQGAINQFKAHLHGKLLFFDSDVDSHIYDFDDYDGDISELAPYGGGGTSYDCIFDFIENNRDKFENINGVIILTDGYCDYPDVEKTNGIPTLWIYTTPDNKPPFGKSATLDMDEFDEDNSI